MMYTPADDLRARLFLSRLIRRHYAAVLTVRRFAGWRL